MLEDKKEVVKEPKTVEVTPTSKEVKETKKYTVIKTVTLDKVYNPGSIVEVEIGSEQEKYLLTKKFINKYGISRSN
jgi:adenylate cyclase class IV